MIIPIVIPKTIAKIVAANTKRIVTGIANAKDDETWAPSRPTPKSGLPTNTPKMPLIHRK